jgi:uncharacterized protein YggE
MKHLIILSLLLFANKIFAQVQGNVGYQRNNKNKTENVYFQKINQKDTDIVIEAAVLSNELATSFVLVFGVSQEGKTVNEATTLINKRLAGLVAELKSLKISENDFYIDLITQNRVYDYELNATNTVAKEKLAGFEIKKNITIHFADRNMIDKITVAASNFEIFDLIKVDYIKTNTEEIRTKLLDEAIKVIENKKLQYLKIMNIKLRQSSYIISEQFAIQQPCNMYETYNAYITNNVNDYDENYNDRLKKLSLRKMTTSYFSPTDYSSFDKVLQPIIIEPVIQYSLRIVVRFLVLQE